jgi:plastocyanin
VQRSSALILLMFSLSLLPAMTAPARGIAGTVYITIYDYGFLPKNENITTGTMIIWNNTGAQGHTIFSDGTPSFQSSPYTLQPYGQTGQHTYSIFFGQAGIYHYYCSIHLTMTGTLNVTGSTVSPPPGNGGNGPPSSGSGSAGSLSDYLIPLTVVAALIVGGVAVFSWRKRSSKTRPKA